MPGTKRILGYQPGDGSGEPALVSCPIEELVEMIGGRWKAVILWWLLASKQPLRFKTLRQKMPGISQKVLTERLRELERDGLVKREMFREMPVRVEYSLTPFGRKLQPVLRVLEVWSCEHLIETKKSMLNAAVVRQA